VKRLRALTLALLPVEVDTDSISEPTSRIITPQVVAAYRAAAGDFTEAVGAFGSQWLTRLMTGQASLLPFAC